MTSILKADTIQDTDGNNIINENSNQITNIVDLSAGDYVEIYVYDDGGSAGILSSADQYSYFTGYRLIE